MKTSEVITRRIFPSGGWEVVAIVNGYRCSRVFFGYSRREAVRLFVARLGEY